MATDTPSTGDPGDAGLVDWKTARDVVGGDLGLLAEVVDAFLQEAPQQMAAIRRAIDAADAPTLRRAAHTLKGSLRYFGARQAYELAWKLEMAGQNNQLSDIQTSTRELDSLLSRILAILSAYLQRGNTP